MTNKERHESAVEQFDAYKSHESVRRLATLVEARIECLRDTLESNESEEVRGGIKELRKLIKILGEQKG